MNKVVPKKLKAVPKKLKTVPNLKKMGGEFVFWNKFGLSTFSWKKPP